MPFSSLETSYEGLIFDCDGTLTDSMPLHYITWRETLAGYGIDFPEDRFYQMGGIPSDKIVEILAGEQGVEVCGVTVGDEKEEAFLEYLPKLKPLNWVCDIARKYADTLAVSVASGGFRPIVMAQLETCTIADLFPHVVTAEDTEKHKPEPDVFLEAARRMGVAPEKCLVFEDSGLGIQAALSAGMHYVDVTESNPKPRSA